MMASLWDRIGDRLFNRKASATAGLVAESVGLGRPVYTTRNYDNLAREGFAANAYVYRAVTTLAHAGAMIPWKLTTKGRGQQERDADPDHPLLLLMNHPNADQGGVVFWSELLSYWLLSGNGYVEMVRPFTGNRPPVELHALRPERMRVVPDTVGAKEFQYGINGRYVTMPAENIIHLKLFNPLDDWYGMSPIVVAAKLVDQMNAANDWNVALFQNGTKPDGVFSATGSLTDSQRLLIREDLRRLYQGARNARRPMLLEGGVTWQQTGMNPVDADWLNGKVQAAREIAIAIGVPPELLGDAANKTYSNVQEARKAFYSEGVLPLIYMLRDMLQTRVVPLFGPRMTLDVDVSGIEALQEDLQTKRAFVVSAWGAGIIMLNEARKDLGYEQLTDGDVFWHPHTGDIIPEEELIPEVAPPPDLTALPPTDPTLLLPAPTKPPQLTPPKSPAAAPKVAPAGRIRPTHSRRREVVDVHT